MVPSARRETGDAELLNVGEPRLCGNPEPGLARSQPGRCRDGQHLSPASSGEHPSGEGVVCEKLPKFTQSPSQFHIVFKLYRLLSGRRSGLNGQGSFLHESCVMQ